MHSSRMRTGHSLTVCWGLLPGWCAGEVPGGVPEGGVAGVCARGGVPEECVPEGGVPERRGVWSVGGWYPSMH